MDGRRIFAILPFLALVLEIVFVLAPVIALVRELPTRRLDAIRPPAIETAPMTFTTATPRGVCSRSARQHV
jgi:hypothetical protein